MTRISIGLGTLLYCIGSVIALAHDAPESYLRLHCSRNKNAIWPFQEPPPLFGDSKDSRVFHLDKIPLEVSGDKLVLNFLPLIREGTVSRRRYDVPKLVEELIPKLCVEETSRVLAQIKENEFRWHFNELYPSKNEVPQSDKYESISFGDWYLFRRNHSSIQNITPSPPGFVDYYPSRALIVARSPEELWTQIAVHYRMEGWEYKQMNSAYVEKIQRDWMASLQLDFSKQMVIGIFYGAQDIVPDAEIGIEDVRQDGAEIRVYTYTSNFVANSATVFRYPYPYYDLILSERSELPVAHYEGSQRIGYSNSENLKRIQRYFQERNISDLVPVFEPLSSGAVALAYPHHQFFKVERKLPERYLTLIMRVDEKGNVNEITNAADYGVGLISGWGPENRQRIVSIALMILSGAKHGGYSPELLRRNVICKKGDEGRLYCQDQEQNNRFVVYFDDGGNFIGIDDHLSAGTVNP